MVVADPRVLHENAVRNVFVQLPRTSPASRSLTGKNIRADRTVPEVQPPTRSSPLFILARRLHVLLLQALELPLHGHTTVIVLQFVTRLMGIKSKFAFSASSYKAIVDLISDILPVDHKVPKDMYRLKKLLKALGMRYKKIDMCPTNCMLF